MKEVDEIAMDLTASWVNQVKSFLSPSEVFDAFVDLRKRTQELLYPSTTTPQRKGIMQKVCDSCRIAVCYNCSQCHNMDCDDHFMPREQKGCGSE